jgi:hypothetical protein
MSRISTLLTDIERAVLKSGNDEQIYGWYERTGAMLDSHADAPTAEREAYKEIFGVEPEN